MNQAETWKSFVKQEIAKESTNSTEPEALDPKTIEVEPTNEPEAPDPITKKVLDRLLRKEEPAKTKPTLLDRLFRKEPAKTKPTELLDRLFLEAKEARAARVAARVMEVLFPKD